MSVDSIKDALIIANNEIPLFKQCELLESCGHSRNFDAFFDVSLEDPIIHFGWIVAIANLVEKNVVVVCSDVAFKSLRNDGNTLLAYKYCDSITAENSILVGVAGSAIFHHLISDGRNALFWSSTELADPLTEENLFDRDLPVTRNIDFEIDNRLRPLDESVADVVEEIGDESDDDGVNEEVAIPIDAELEAGDGEDDAEPTVISLATACRQMRSLTPERFLASNERIDFDLELNADINSERVPTDQTYDIDGIFIVMNADEMKMHLKSSFTVWKTPKKADNRNILNFLKTFKNSSVVLPANCEMFKIGFLAPDFGKFDVFFYHGLNPDIVDEGNRTRLLSVDRQKIIKECLDYAKALPCNRCREHGPDCTSQQFRTQRTSHRPIAGVAEDLITEKLLPCFVHHFQVKLNNILNVAHTISGFYLRSIGTKNSLVTDNPEEFFLNLERIYAVVEIRNLKSDAVAFDFCVQSVKRGEIPVI